MPAFTDDQLLRVPANQLHLLTDEEVGRLADMRQREKHKEESRQRYTRLVTGGEDRAPTAEGTVDVRTGAMATVRDWKDQQLGAAKRAVTAAKTDPVGTATKLANGVVEMVGQMATLPERMVMPNRGSGSYKSWRAAWWEDIAAAFNVDPHEAGLTDADLAQSREQAEQGSALHTAGQLAKEVAMTGVTIANPGVGMALMGAEIAPHWGEVLENAPETYLMAVGVPLAVKTGKSALGMVNGRAAQAVTDVIPPISKGQADRLIQIQARQYAFHFSEQNAPKFDPATGKVVSAPVYDQPVAGAQRPLPLDYQKMGPSPYTLPEEPTISKAAQVGREPSQRNLETLAEAKRIINEAYPTMPLESTSPLAIVEQANGILEQRRARQVSMFPAARIHSPKTLVLEDVPPLVPESPAPRPHVEYTRQPSLPFEGGAEIQGRFPFDRNEIPSLALKAQAVIETPPSQMVDSVVNGGQAAQDMSGGMGMVIDSVAASFAKASMAPESAILNAALKDADALLGGRVIWWKPQFSYLRGIAPDLLAKFMGAVSVKQNVRNTFMTKRVEPWMKKTVRNTETLHDVARLMIDQQARDMKAAGGQGNLSHIKTLTDEQRTEIMLRPGRKQAVDEYLKKILPEFNAWRQAMGHEVDPAQAYWPMRAFDPKRHKGKLRYDVESGALLTAGEVRVKGMRSSTGVTKKRYIAEREAGSEHARTGTASAYLADPWTLFEEEMVERVGAVKTRELKSAVLRESIKPEDLIDDEGYTKPTVTWRGAKVEPATIKFSHFDEAGTETLQAVTVPQPLQAAYDVVMDMARRGEHGGALMHLLNDTVIEQQLRGVAEPIAHSLTAAAGLMESPHLDKVMTSPVRKALAHYWITRLPAILWEVKKMAGPEIAAQAKMARELGAFRAKERKVSLPSEREVAITKLGREMGKAVGLPFKFMRDVVFGDMVESQEGIGGLEHRLKLLQARAIHVGEGVPFAEALHKANEFGGTYVTAMAPKMAQLLRGVPIAGDAFASTMTAGLRLGASTFAGIPIVGSGPAGLVRGTVKGLQARSAAVGAKEFVNQTIHRAQWRNATEMVAGIYGTHMMMTYMLHGKWPWQMPDHGVRGVQVYPIPSMGIGKEDDKPAYLPLRYCMPATSRFLSMTGVKAAYEGIADGDRSFDAISKDMILGATNAWLRRFGTGGGRQVWTLATGRKVSLSKDYEQYRAAEDSANWDRVISSRIKAAASEVLPFAESTLSIKDAYAHGEGPYTSSTMNKIQATLGMFGFELPSGPTATRIAAKPLTDQRRLANSVGEGIVFEASRKFAADPKAEVEYTNKRLREEMDKFTDPAARIWLFKLVMDNGLKQKIKLQVTAAQAQAMAEGN